MVAAADAGTIELGNYWSVGDTRSINLSAMDATVVNESHTAQIAEFVLMHEGGYKKADGSGTVNFIVGLKNCLAEKGSIINASYADEVSWKDTERREWCNSVFYNSIPSSIKGVFKQFQVISADHGNSTNLSTTNDYFTLAADKEIFGTASGSSTQEANALFQYDYYINSINRRKFITTNHFI